MGKMEIRDLKSEQSVDAMRSMSQHEFLEELRSQSRILMEVEKEEEKKGLGSLSTSGGQMNRSSIIATREQENPLFIIIVVVFLVFFFMRWKCRRSDGTNDNQKKIEVIALIEKCTGTGTGPRGDRQL
jgi:uncharacterized membrane protein (DUF106 family)